MALTPLGQIYERSTPAFDQKLAGVVQIFQGFKNTQLQKQQIAEQFEMRKEMVDYEYEKRGELAEQQAGAKAMQDYQKNLKESFEQTQKTLTDYTKFITTDNTSANKYGLANYNFDIVPTTNEAGMPTGANVSITDSYSQQAVDPLTFRSQVENRNEFANTFLDKLDSGDMKLGESTTKQIEIGGEMRTIQTIGSDNVEQIMVDIKSNPETALQYYGMWSVLGEGALISRLDEASAEADKARVPQSGMNIIAPLNELRTQLQGSNFAPREYVLEKDSGWWFGIGDSQVQTTIDYTQPIAGIQSDINTNLQKVYGEEFDLTSVPINVKRAIIVGNPEPVEEYGNAEIARLFEDAQTNEQIKELVKNHALVEGIHQQYGTAIGSTGMADRLYINFENIPDNISTVGDYKNLLSTVSPEFQAYRPYTVTSGALGNN